MKPVFDDYSVHCILKQIIPLVKNPYALSYMKAALNHPDTGKSMTGHELKVQVLYILNNLSGWRGEDARRIKQELKEYSQL